MTTWTIACECGWQVTGTEAEIVPEAQAHGRAIHNMDITPGEAMAMATAVD